ncbi:hypothetical protein MMC21_000711 [Puttea exsequens]|nr:hypothetical protein [Puttea exsequens]
MFSKKDKAVLESPVPHGDLEKGQSYLNRETYSAPQFFSSSTTRRLPQPIHSPLTALSTQSHPTDDLHMHPVPFVAARSSRASWTTEDLPETPIKQKRYRPALELLEGRTSPETPQRRSIEVSPGMLKIVNDGSNLPPSNLMLQRGDADHEPASQTDEAEIPLADRVKANNEAPIRPISGLSCSALRGLSEKEAFKIAPLEPEPSALAFQSLEPGYKTQEYSKQHFETTSAVRQPASQDIAQSQPSCPPDINSSGEFNPQGVDPEVTVYLPSPTACHMAIVNPTSTVQRVDVRSSSAQRKAILIENSIQEPNIYEDIRAYEREEDTALGGRPIIQRSSHCRIDDQAILFPSGNEHYASGAGSFEFDRSTGGLSQFAWTPEHSDDGHDYSAAPAIDLASANEDGHLVVEDDRESKDEGYEPAPKSGDGFEHLHAMESLNVSKSSSELPSQQIPPSLDVPIPMSNLSDTAHPSTSSSFQHHRSMGSRDNSSQVRFSGFISDGSSHRPMSLREIEESLGEMVKTGMRPNSLSASSSFRLSMDNRQSSDIIHPKKTTPTVSQAFAVDGPGGSQSTSSLSTDPSSGAMPTSAARCPDLFRNNSRLAKAMKDNGVRDTSRLAQAFPLKPGDQDWETVSDMKEINAGSADFVGSQTQTGSSLADNSELGEASPSKAVGNITEGIRSGTEFHQEALPRRNKTFWIVRNDQTGEEKLIQQSSFGAPTHDPVLLQLGEHAQSYHHPAPLSPGHVHPLKSSPPYFGRDQALKAANNNPTLQSATLRSMTASDSFSSAASSSMSLDTNEERVVVEGGQLIGSKDRSFRSSAWLSTVSEGDSGVYSPSANGNSFSKVAVLSPRGNITGTPEGTGAREVGSSLADGSSPGAPLSSSPVPFSSSPPQFQQSVQKMPSSLSAQESRPPAHEPSISNQNARNHYLCEEVPVATPQSPSSFVRTDRGTSNNPWHKYLPAQRLQGRRKPSPRRRRSSSESDSRTVVSPLAHKSSGIATTINKSHRHGAKSTGLLLRGAFTRSDEDLSKEQAYELAVRRPGVQDRDNNREAVVATSIGAFFREGLVGPNIMSPDFDHPVYGTDRLWASPLPASDRAKGRPNTHARPIARPESPHLWRLPRLPSTETLQRQDQISFWCLLPVMVVPPFALLYGHSCLDSLLSYYTTNEINEFGRWYKWFALAWGYAGSGILVTGLVIAAVLGVGT